MNDFSHLLVVFQFLINEIVFRIVLYRMMLVVVYLLFHTHVQVHFVLCYGATCIILMNLKFVIEFSSLYYIFILLRNIGEFCNFSCITRIE